MTPNEKLAAAAERTLADGPMSWTQRREDHVRYLDETFGNGLTLLRGIAMTTPASSCAVCVGMWAMLAGVQDKRARPKTPAITTWAGFGGFGGRYWVPCSAKGFRVQRGDVLYWCGGNEKTWHAATNGHVGVALVGEGHMWTTAEGGGGADGTNCRLSDGPKDIRASHGKPLRGVWRPNGAAALNPLPLTPSVPPAWRDIAPGMRGKDVEAWQRSLLRWRPDCLPKYGADGAYGTRLDSETLLATRAFQTCRGLPATGVVNRQTWDAGEPS